MDLVNDLEGFENLGADSQQERLQAIYDHLVKTRNIIAGKPQLVQNVDYPPAFLKMLDYAIENWNTPNRDKALTILAQNEDALNKHYQLDIIPENSDLEGLDNDWSELDNLSDEELLGELSGKKSKAKKQAKKEQKKADPTKKGFFKKVGEAVKKGGKAFIRYNPVTISARNGFLLALKLNIKKMASKLKWGYATKEQAATKGITADKWEKSKNALAKVEKMFADKLQGKRDKLKSAILKGKAGGLSGTAESEFLLSGLGAAPAAAALAAAVPVIASCLKIMVDSGVMSQDEAGNLQMEIDASVAEGDNIMATDEDFKSDTTDDGSGDSGDDSSGEGGFFGWVTRNPLIAIGGAGLAIWGVSKMFGGKKKAPGTQNLSGTPAPAKKKPGPKKKSKAKTSARKAKVKAIRLS
ncbi:MAG TPA: hypothetical protein DHV48_13230 [Prolixibacteraceae bacterium]|nr:hypothetical protein [Prolixibacteraceae bacterium]